MIDQTRQQTKYCLSSKKGYNNSSTEDEESAFEKQRKDIEANQDNALSLCTEKVLLARQACDLVWRSFSLCFPLFMLCGLPGSIAVRFSNTME